MAWSHHTNLMASCMCAADTHQHRHGPSAQISRTTSQSFHDNVIIFCEVPLQGWCAHWSKLTKSNIVLCYDRKPEMHFLKIGLCLVTKSCLTLWLHGLQHASLPWPSRSPKVCSNSCPLSQWCHPTISSSCIGFCSTWFNYIYIYIYPLPLEPSTSTPITEHWVELPVLYSSFPLAIYFTRGDTHTSFLICSEGKSPKTVLNANK